MDWLLLATGCTGGLTLLFIFRQLFRWLQTPLSISGYFSPQGGCTDAIVQAVKRARREVLVYAGTFHSEPIAKAIVDAKGRGLNVDIVLDGGTEPKTMAQLMEQLGEGITPLIDTEHTSHNHVIILDAQTVITGGFPFTPEAEAEDVASLLVIQGQKDLARGYRQQFLDHKAHSQPARDQATAKPSRTPEAEALPAAKEPALKN